MEQICVMATRNIKKLAMRMFLVPFGVNGPIGVNVPPLVGAERRKESEIAYYPLLVMVMEQTFMDAMATRGR